MTKVYSARGRRVAAPEPTTSPATGSPRLPAGAFAVGAIAVDDVEGDTAADVGYYAVTGESSEAAAKAAAMKGCREAGMKNCKIGVWFTRCGAYASGPKTTGYATGASQQAVAKDAVDECGSGCKLVIAECE